MSVFIATLDDSAGVPIVVSHGLSIVFMVAAWLMLTPAALEPISFAADATSITVLRTDKYGGRTLERLNDVAHLAGTESWVALGDLT
jgi:broad specificity phosphatase PhoE